MRNTAAIALTLLAFSLGSCGIHHLSKIGVYQELDAEEYLKHTIADSIIIIDVRTKSEYSKSHIAEAKNVSFFGGHFRKELEALDLDTTNTILIYCETQHRSLFVAKKVYKAGFNNIVDLDKGMMKWRKNNYPWVSSSEEANLPVND